MMSGIRLGTAALSGRIFAGYPTQTGDGFKGKRHDVTGDVLKTIAEHVGIGNVVDVQCDGEAAYSIAVIPPGGAPLAQDVIRLVLAAREVAFGGLFDGGSAEQRAAIQELDSASEVFASRVSWDRTNALPQPLEDVG